MTQDSIEQVLKEVRDAIGAIHYGSVEITIHDSKVVQIERKEKVRFNVNRTDRATGGSHSIDKGE